MATDEMWYDRDDEMGWKDSDGLGKYRQGTTTNLRTYYCSWIMGMADMVSSEDSGGRSRWRRFRTTDMDTMEE